MNEIICPHCKKAFKADEAGYADILKQVRDHQFEEEISNRLALAEKDKENAVKLAEANAKNSLKYKQELALMKNQNIDITNFEDKIVKFRDGFAKNYISAFNNFQREITEIDNSIKKMQKVKEALTTSENQLRLANQKAEDLTIKRLTYNNPTMKQKFKDLKDEKE